MNVLPSIDDVIAAVEAKVAHHRDEAHGGAVGFFDCALCGILEHRSTTLRRHKAAGGRFIPVKGLEVDPETGEMTVLRIEGTAGHGAEVAQRIAIALKRFGLPADAWETSPIAPQGDRAPPGTDV